MWLLGSDLVVIDPPRKGLDASLIDALKNISSVELLLLYFLICTSEKAST